MKREPRGLEKIFVNHTSDKEEIFKMYKEFMHFKRKKKPKNPINKWAEELNKIFPRKMYRWLMGT